MPTRSVIYHFRTRGIGAEGVHIAGIANALDDLGFPVTFVSPTGNNPRLTAGQAHASGGGWARIARLAPRLCFELIEIAYNTTASRKLDRAVRQCRPAFIYERHAFFLNSTRKIASRQALPLVVEVNELVGDPRIRKQPFLAALARRSDRLLFSGASLIVTVSPHLKRRICNEHGIGPAKVLVLPNAVARDECRIPADGTAFRRANHLDNALVVGFVGMLVHWHRLELLVDLTARLAADFPTLRLLLVGEGPLANDLAQRAEAQGIGDRIVFSGTVPHADIPKAIAAMDVAVVPHSNAYRSPIKLFEYMAQGRAIAAPATEPIAQVIEDGVNGRTFPPDDTTEGTAFLQTLAELLASPDLRARLGARARRDVLAKHTWHHNAQAVLDHLALA